MVPWHEQPTNDVMDTDQTSHLVVMTTKSGKKFWQVAIIRKRLGTVLRGSPLKPFAKGIKGLKTFCKGVFRGGTLRKSELETINNLGVSTASPDEIPVFTTPPEEHLANQHTARPEVPSAEPTKTPTLAEVASKDGNDATKATTTTTVGDECALPTETIPALTTESPLDTPQVRNAVTNEIKFQEEAASYTEVTVAPVESASPSLGTKPDTVAEPTPAPETYTIIDTIIDTTSDSPVVEAETPEVPTIVCTEPVAIERALDTEIQNTPEPVQMASSREDAIFDTVITSLEKEQPTIQEAYPTANIDHVVALVEESESDGTVATPEIPDNEDSLDSRTEIESEAEEDLNKPLGIYVMQDIAHKDQEPAAIPMSVAVYPIFYEDDFDASVSSIQGAEEIDKLLESNGLWFVPQIVEKGKLNRQMVQNRFAAQRTAQGHYRNLNLEKAARDLVLDIPAPMRVIIRAATPAVAKETETPTTPETPTTQAVETPKKARVAKPIPMAIGLPSRTHSRSSSGSSAESADASLDSEQCPDTPLTEYSVTSNKDEVTPRDKAKKMTKVPSADAAGTFAAETTMQGEGETTN